MSHVQRKYPLASPPLTFGQGTVFPCATSWGGRTECSATRYPGPSGPPVPFPGGRHWKQKRLTGGELPWAWLATIQHPTTLVRRQSPRHKETTTSVGLWIVYSWLARGAPPPNAPAPVVPANRAGYVKNLGSDVVLLYKQQATIPYLQPQGQRHVISFLTLLRNDRNNTIW